MTSEQKEKQTCPTCGIGRLSKRGIMWCCDACPMGFTDGALRTFAEGTPEAVNRVAISNPLGLDLEKICKKKSAN